jgi:N-acetylglucosaminyl-diphospho-decaprenol L-rhamnosyltransferase
VARHDEGDVTSDPLRVAVVIVTYNSADNLGSCLASLPDGLDGVHLTEIVVADNASKDDTCDIAKNATGLPVRVVELGRNGGYAAGINAGVAALAPHDAVLVINPDVRVRPGAVALLAKAFDRPKVGIAAPRLENPDGSLQPSLRRPPTVLRAWAEAIVGGNRAGRWGTLGELITDPRRYAVAGPATWATGGILLISAEAFRATGQWDESFLLYGEETDFALRAARSGYLTWYSPDSVFEHDGGESGTNPMLWALLTVNRVRIVRRHYGFLAWLGYSAAVVLGEAIRAAAGRRTAKAALTALLRPSKRLRVLPQ